MLIPNNPDIILITSNAPGNELTGPGKYAARTAEYFLRESNVSVLSYQRSKPRFLNKLFFLETSGNCTNAGIVSFLLHIWWSKPRIIHLLCFERVSLFLLLLKPFMKFTLVYTVHGIVRKEDNSQPGLSAWYRWKNRIAEKALFSMADVLFAFNPDIAEAGKALYKSKAAVRVIRPGIDRIFFENQRHMMNLSAKLQVVLMGGFRKREEIIIGTLK